MRATSLDCSDTPSWRAIWVNENIPRTLCRPSPSLSTTSACWRAARGAENAADGAARRRALRLYALLETLYATGLRVSELLALRCGVLATDDRVLTIKGKGGRERLVPLNDAAREALKAHLAAASEDEARSASPWLFASSSRASTSR